MVFSIYESAMKSYIKEQRLALGTFTISQVESFYTDAYEPSLTLRRENLTMQYYINNCHHGHQTPYMIVFLFVF